MQHPTAEAIQQVWTISLGVFVAVLAVVAILLTLILRTSHDIKRGVALIWNVGQRIANNTIQLAMLERTNEAAEKILASAVGVIGATGAVKAHAGNCPGCPACVIGTGWRR